MNNELLFLFFYFGYNKDATPQQIPPTAAPFCGSCVMYVVNNPSPPHTRLFATWASSRFLFPSAGGATEVLSAGEKSVMRFLIFSRSLALCDITFSLSLTHTRLFSVPAHFSLISSLVLVSLPSTTHLSLSSLILSLHQDKRGVQESVLKLSSSSPKHNICDFPFAIDLSPETVGSICRLQARLRV